MFKTALSRTSMYYIRWIFQSLMCVHSLLQPLCYFRMREFRATFRATRPIDWKSLVVKAFSLRHIHGEHLEYTPRPLVDTEVTAPSDEHCWYAFFAELRSLSKTKYLKLASLSPGDISCILKHRGNILDSSLYSF
ncbi:hypothetical protein AB6A40_010604 [Gnathostoma spinigerum]|uniref:Uncharacterized protein n=1 Tax=Gnathostoma spinigerum TaxID=75299 RepID=A0ABD6F3J3_9BILA